MTDSHDDRHDERIRDQFTRQAVPFATASSIRNEEALARIVAMSKAGPFDTSLDVACGPGLLVCAFARAVTHATGIDATPAMLDQARREQDLRGLRNVTFDQGDAFQLPYVDGRFSIVTSRFAFHHLLDPRAALAEMCRVCAAGGRIVVADSAPIATKADAFNAMEKLRDPSHVRAMPTEELASLFTDAGLGQPRIDHYRLDAELEDLLRRSFPEEGDADRIRSIFERSLDDDALDMSTRRENGRIFLSFPVAILAATLEQP
jgi:ubiquinone/menaquinone biosynthesis C-methylase UbiE